jgi:predicted  nucleic acid-binding Zn-ribbon protein
VSDLDKALLRVQEADKEAAQKEKDLREQVQYYKDKCTGMVDEKVVRELQDEVNRLKREIDSLKNT